MGGVSLGIAYGTMGVGRNARCVLLGERCPFVPSRTYASFFCLCLAAACWRKPLGLVWLSMCWEKTLCVCCGWGCSLAGLLQWRVNWFAYRQGRMISRLLISERVFGAALPQRARALEVP